MRGLLNLRLLLILLAAGLAAFGISNGFVAVFWQSRHEVIYQYDVGPTYCYRQECAFSAMLEVANSGRETQPEVVVKLSGLPPDVGGRPRVINLSAAEPRLADPRIEQGPEGGAYVIRLSEFTPGTLTQFMFHGSVPASSMTGGHKPEISIRGEGRMIEGDPRAITFGRFF